MPVPGDAQVIFAAGAVDARRRTHHQPELIAHRRTVDNRRRCAVDLDGKVTCGGVAQGAGRAVDAAHGFHDHRHHVRVGRVASFGHIAGLRADNVERAEVAGQAIGLGVAIGQAGPIDANCPGARRGVGNLHLFRVVEIIHIARRRHDMGVAHNRVSVATG